jgi:hypothetical protein
LALLATIDIDDNGSLKIERFADVLNQLGATVARTSEETKRDSKAQADALTRLVQEHRAYQAEIVKQARTMQEVAGIMKTGTVLTLGHADALRVLNAQVQASSVHSTKYKNDFTQLVNQFKAGTVVTAGMSTALQAASAQHAKAAQAALGQGTSYSKLTGAVQGLIGALGMTGLAYWMKSYLADAFQIAARNQVLATSMGIVAKNAGYSNVTFETQTEIIRKLGITTRESREAVISFAQAELSLADTAKIARAAQDLAAIAGKNSSDAFGTLKTAIETGQPMLLRQFGIMQNLNKLYADFGREVGKTADSLSAYEKRQAMMSLILREADKVAGAYEATMNDVGKAMGSTARLQEELKNQIGENFLPVMKAWIDLTNGLLGSLAKLDPVILAIIAGIMGTVTAILAIVGALRTLILVMGAASVAGLKLQASLGWISLVLAVVGAGVTFWLALKSAVEETVVATTESIAAVKAQEIGFENLLKKVSDLSKTIGEMNEKGEDTALQQRLLQDAVNKVNALYPGMISNLNLATGSYDQNAEAIKRVRGEIKGLMDDQATLAENQLKDAQATQAKMQREFDRAVEQAARSGNRGSRAGIAGRIRGGIDVVTPEELGDMQKALSAQNVLVRSYAETLHGLRVATGEASEAMGRWEAALVKMDDGALLKRALSTAGFSVDQILNMKDVTEVDRAIGAIKSAYEKAEQDGAKFAQAYKSAWESITRTSATSGAALKAADDALRQSGLSQDDYIERLMNAQGMVKSLANLSPEDRALYPNAVRAMDVLNIATSLEKFDAIQLKAAEASKSVSQSMGEMFRNMALEAEEAARQADAQLEDMTISHARATEARHEDLTDRLTASTTSGVDARLRENNRYFRDLQRQIEDEIRLLRRQEEEELRALERKAEEETLSLNRTIDNVTQEFKVKKEALEKFEQIRRALNDPSKTKAEVDAQIKGIEDGFNAEMEALRALYQKQIDAQRDRSRASLDAQHEANDQYIRDQEALLSRAEVVHQQTNARIIKESNFTWNNLSNGAKGFVTTFLNGLGRMGTGMGSFRDLMAGMWNSIKDSALKAINEITGALVSGLMGNGTKGKGVSGMTEALGNLFGRPSTGALGSPMGFMGSVPLYGGGMTGGAQMYDATGQAVAGSSMMSPQIGNMARFGGGAMLAGAGAMGLYQGVMAGSYSQSAMSGAMTGAGIGTMIMPGIGTVIGGGIGLVGGLVANAFGGAEGRRTNDFRDEYIGSQGGVETLQGRVTAANDQRVGGAFAGLMRASSVREVEAAVKSLDEALQLVEAKEGLARTHVAFEALRKQTTLLGFDLTKLYEAKTIDEYNAAQEELNRLLEAQAIRLEGLSKAMSGITQRVTGFTMGLDKATKSAMEGLDEKVRERLESDYEKAQEGGYEGGLSKYAMANGPEGLRDQLTGTRDKAQDSFGSLTRSTTATFANVVRETGSLTEALRAAEGPMQDLITLQEEWGFVADDSFNRLRGLYQTILDNDDVATSLSGLTMEIEGMGEAGMLTQQRFNDLGADAARQLAILQERGVSVEDQMLLMQPTLQALYEAQQNFGIATDESTQALIDMGVANGTVGDQFKDVNQKMLDVLLLIADTMGADIPDAYKNFRDRMLTDSDVVEGAADGVGDAVGDGIIDELDRSQQAIDDWANYAEQRFYDVEQAATGIALGHSPGGLKEIPLQVAASVPAIERLHKSMRMLKAAEGYATGSAQELGAAASVPQASGGGGNVTVILSPNITVSAMDGEDIHNTLINRTMPKMLDILGSGQGQLGANFARVVTAAPKRR